MTTDEPHNPRPFPDEELPAALGDEFLAYVCATEPQRIAEARAGRALNEPRATVLGLALEVARGLSARRRRNASNDTVPPSEQGLEPLRSSFGAFFELTDAGLTFPNALRMQAGGTIRALPDREDDPLRHALHRLARDFWPLLLLAGEPPAWAFPLAGAAGALFRHPAQQDLRDALGQIREPLRRLYPDVSDELADSVRIASNAGSTGSLQVSLLGERLIGVAAERSNRPLWPDGDPLFEELDRALEELRVLARGRPAEVPTTVGLSGLSLPGDHELVTALGTLRPAARRQHRLAGVGEAHVTLDVTFPLTYTRVPGDEVPQGAPRGFWESWRTFESRVDLVRLAVLLALGPESGQVLRIVSEQVHDPLFAHGARGRLGLSPFAAPLDPADEPEILRWSERIHRHFHPNIALAVRRAISAADALRDPDDALIDAVIALESLFGTGESEVGFRLQTALAFLLADTEAARRELHAEVGELYSARSRLVHGVVMADRMQLFALRGRAVALAVRSLRLLFSTHHALIADPGRGKRIILRGSE